MKEILLAEKGMVFLVLLYFHDLPYKIFQGLRNFIVHIKIVIVVVIKIFITM